MHIILDINIQLLYHVKMKRKASLKEWRLSKGMSQIQAANLFGITQPSLCRLEKETANPSPKLTLEIEKITGVPKENLRPDIYEKCQ